MTKKIFKTDWLASKPVFYNEKTLKISYNINDVINFNDIKFHPEGFNNFLDFGYSVFEQTPINHVKFLRHSSEICIKNNKLKITEHPDPVLKWFKDHPNLSDEEYILNTIKYKINDWVEKQKGKIVVPTSGGLDSRLIDFFVKDKSRIRAYTYGVSSRQEDSYEVKHAEKVCEQLGITWQRVELGNFHEYINNWLDLFGSSVHAHGMYHMEFYDKILKTQKPELFLSGIFGDVWAGGVNSRRIKNYAELSGLGYTHGMNAEKSKSKFNCEYRLRKLFFKKNDINDHRFQVVTIIRLKMILISYLLRTPEHFGFKVWSPFLDMDIALGMLNLPPERRKDRQWQKDFFKKNNLYVEDQKFYKSSRENSLNNQALVKIPLAPLSKDILVEFIDLEYINWINKNIANNFFAIFFSNLLKKRFIGTALNLVGFKDPRAKAYSAYLTLKPIEELIKKRNKK